jgi:hypothetical protein
LARFVTSVFLTISILSNILDLLVKIQTIEEWRNARCDHMMEEEASGKNQGVRLGAGGFLHQETGYGGRVADSLLVMIRAGFIYSFEQPFG